MNYVNALYEYFGLNALTLTTYSDVIVYTSKWLAMIILIGFVFRFVAQLFGDIIGAVR